MAGRFTNITSATTTQIEARRVTLKNIVVNKDLASAVITIYDNITNGTTAAAANNISTSQTPSGAGNLTITGTLATGGVATLGYGKKVTITTAADETTKTFTVTGTSATGAVQSEVIAGVDTTLTTGTLDFLTVTQIAVSAATTGAITVGATVQAGTKIATVTSPGTLLCTQNFYPYDVSCRFGLTIVTSAAQDLTVVTE